MNRLGLGRNQRAGFSWAFGRRVPSFYSTKPGHVPGCMGKDERLFGRWCRRLDRNDKAWRACKLCAQAMDLTIRSEHSGGFRPCVIVEEIVSEAAGYECEYAPLIDDAQAMALVKKFGLHITKGPNQWVVDHPAHISGNPDLNRAIVECVANMEANKK